MKTDRKNTTLTMITLAILLCAGCSDDRKKTAASETDKPHMLQTQQDMLQRAKDLEGTVEQSYQRQLEALQENQ